MGYQLTGQVVKEKDRISVGGAFIPEAARIQAAD
jgi:hypothetical protein